MKSIAGLLLALCAVTCSGRTCAANIPLEPHTYFQDFESRELCAWASYPLWQDTAYDDNFHAGEIVPGDPNISIVQYVAAYSRNDRYAGAQKKLDMYLTGSSTVSLRFYLKTNQPVEFFKVRIAAGRDGKVDYTVGNPQTNGWCDLTVSYADFISENPRLAGKEAIRVTGLAFLMKIPDADPFMPFYLGIDDVVVRGARKKPFTFIEPKMHKLPEWKPYIARSHYRPGDSFTLRGRWDCGADKVTVRIAPFSDPAAAVLERRLESKSGEYSLPAMKLRFEPGLYLAVLEAWKQDKLLADTEFTLYIEPDSATSPHPRLWFTEAKRKKMVEELKTGAFSGLAKELADQAVKQRADYPLETMVYDFDQFPEEDWLVTRYAWSLDRIRSVGETAKANAVAYSLLGDETAGEYAKDVLVTYAGFPSWNHPWMKKRGRHFYLLMGDMAMDFAISYDLVWGLMSENERELVRKAFKKEVIDGAHRAYVHANLVTSNTSNWIAAIMGGSLMCQAAIYGESAGTAPMEPCFTGAVFKMNALIQKAVGSDGGYGEGYNYYHYSSRSWSKSLPALENVFGIDLSAKLNGVYSELAWAGLIRDKYFFYNGDSRGGLRPMTAWAWLLDKYEDPLLAWMYYFLNPPETKTVSGFDTFSKSGVSLFSIMQGTTLEDLIHDTRNVTASPPFDQNPVRLFRDIGTTVFKSGWESDDFAFVLRTGPFYNHQHLDQGTFWLADRGTVFIGEHYGSSYYDDALYESHYTQPIAHSTILIDHNPQSQRTGDPLDFIEGLNDHAFVHHFLDGGRVAFVSGDLGGLYWGKVAQLRRNVLYLKPRTLLMLDTVVPAGDDADVSALFQTRCLDGIEAGHGISSITKDGATLLIRHLSPDTREVKAVELPHFLRDFNETPLRRRGYLSVTARTEGLPMVIANMLSTDTALESIRTEQGNGCVTGLHNGVGFAFAERPGSAYTAGNITTDALVTAWGGDFLFAALATMLVRDGTVLVESSAPVTVEIRDDAIRYCLAEQSEIALHVARRPRSVTVNGGSVTVAYDPEKEAVFFTLDAGEGVIGVE